MYEDLLHSSNKRANGLLKQLEQSENEKESLTVTLDELRQEAKAMQDQMNIEIQYKAKFAQLYNTERKKNNGPANHLLVSQSSSKYDIPKSVNQLPSLHLQQSRGSSQASPRDLNDSTLKKIIALDNEVDGFKREC